MSLWNYISTWVGSNKDHGGSGGTTYYTAANIDGSEGAKPNSAFSELLQEAEFCANRKQYAEALKALQDAVRRFPNERFVCEIQMAQVYQKMGQIRKAIELLVAARVHGACAEQVDEKIWAICSCSIRQLQISQKSSVIEEYLRLCPSGKHQTEALCMIQNLRRTLSN